MTEVTLHLVECVPPPRGPAITPALLLAVNDSDAEADWESEGGAAEAVTLPLGRFHVSAGR
jgi:hypothetical protein